ncbi:hypothetical protein OAD02_00550 [Alphaproteobacteria bacterium]|nr:hypothetical protein [Alphaproteobacteria bacterium]
MKYLISILLIFFFVSNAKSEQLADECKVFEDKLNAKLEIREEITDWLPHVMNRTNIKNIKFHTLRFKDQIGYYGIKISYGDISFNFCYPHYIAPTGILIETKLMVNNGFTSSKEKLVFSILTSYNCGNPCSNSLVYTVSMPLDDLNGVADYRGLTIREHRTISTWYVDHLSFNEAYGLHKKLELDLYWKGKWYKVK